MPKLGASTYAIGALVILLVGAVFYIGHLRTKAREAARSAEAAQLQAKGLLVASGEKQSALKADIGELQTRFDGLSAALKAAQAKTPATKVVEVATFTTGPAIVVQAPREPGVPCVLAPLDTGDVRIAEIRLQTKLGNIIAIGVAEAWRLKPLPEVKLFSSAFETPTSALHDDIKALDNSLPGWGGGPWLSFGTGGWGLGGIAQTPEAQVWFFKAKAEAALTVGPNGYVSGGVGAVLR